MFEVRQTERFRSMGLRVSVIWRRAEVSGQDRAASSAAIPLVDVSRRGRLSELRYQTTPWYKVYFLKRETALIHPFGWRRQEAQTSQGH